MLSDVQKALPASSLEHYGAYGCHVTLQPKLASSTELCQAHSSSHTEEAQAATRLGQRDELRQEVLGQRGERRHGKQELQGPVHLRATQPTEPDYPMSFREYSASMVNAATADKSSRGRYTCARRSLLRQVTL